MQFMANTSLPDDHACAASEAQAAGAMQKQSSRDGSRQAPMLLSASNDGTVAVWDLSKGCEQGRHDLLPRQVTQTDALHTGGQT